MFNFPEKNQLTSFWQTLKFFNRLLGTIYKLSSSILSKFETLLNPVFVFSVAALISSLILLAGWLFLAAIDGFALSIAAAIRVYLLLVLLSGGISFLFLRVNRKDLLQKINFRAGVAIPQMSAKTIKMFTGNKAFTSSATSHPKMPQSLASNKTYPVGNNNRTRRANNQTVRLQSFYIISEYQPNQKEGE
ncbi:MAG: hypothetical protein WA584_08990 [Pyrinomonadaceae bacterium]